MSEPKITYGKPTAEQKSRFDAQVKEMVEGRMPDPIGCGCDEYPECTHALYFYMGHKAALAAQASPAPEREGEEKARNYE